MTFREIFTRISGVFKGSLRRFLCATSYLSYLRSLILIISIVSINSCEGDGCVEADDFGEFMSKTLIIKASQSIDSCEYDTINRENLTSQTHGAGIRSCFTTGSVSITDESSVLHTSSIGCKYWQPLVYNADGTTTANANVNLSVMNLCVSQCVNACNTRVMSGSTNPNPSWTDTSDPTGTGEVIISAGSKISVRATGSVTLGGSQLLKELYVYPNENSFLPSSKNNTGVEIYQESVPGKILGLKFAGGFVDNDTILNSSPPANTGNVGLMNLPEKDSLEEYFGLSPANGEKRADLVNAMRRIILYVDEFPLNHSYVKGTSDLYSDSNVRGIPIRPYHQAWRCSYTGSNLFESSCSNDLNAYSSQYTGIDTTLINNAFPISSVSRVGVNVSVYGGILKTNSDNLLYRDESAYDPFATCNSGFDCPGISAIEGIMVYNSGSSSPSSAQIQRIGRDSQIYFKYLNPSCSGNVNIKIKESDTAIANLYQYDNVDVSASVGATGWSPGVISSSSGQSNPIHVSGQSNQYIEIERVGSAELFNSGTTQIDCMRSLAIKFVPYYDFTINKSGLVSFANLAPTGSSGSCTIKFRIINPAGSHGDQNIGNLANVYSISSSTFDPDFYEYRDFNDNTSLSPENGSAITTVDNNWNSDFLGKIFVRKGQKIRFAPESWSGTWSPSGLQRKCGTGMAIRIEPRPAYLCRGEGSVSVRNPSCVPNMVGGETRGCQTTSPLCINDTTSNTFCPDVANCVGAITLTNPTNSVSPRTGTSATSITRMTFPTDATGMANHACGYVYAVTSTNTGTTASPTITTTRTSIDQAKKANCERCQDAMFLAGTQSPIISQSGMAHCYNLENYRGKVENITNDFYNFFSTLPAPTVAHSSITKGAVKLQRFNGRSGHIGDYGSSIDAEGFVPSQVNHFFNTRGRLTLMILDGQDFKPSTLNASYANNGTPSINSLSFTNPTYSTSARNNGFRIKLSNFLEFGNGENLEMKFCKESSGTSTNCRLQNLPSGSINLTNVPQLVHTDEVNNSFAFDKHGNMFRKVGPRAGKNNCNGVLTGDRYFCHCRGDFNGNNVPDACAHILSSGSTIADGDSSSCGSAGSCLYRLTFKINDPEVMNCVIPSLPAAGAPAPSSSEDPAVCATDSTAVTASMPLCNGIKVNNVNFEPTVASAPDPVTQVTTQIPATANVGKVCNSHDLVQATGATPVTCAKEFNCASRYSNNTGRYNVVVRVKEKNNNVSGLVSAVIDPVLRIMDGYTDSSGVRVPGQAERIYKLIITDPVYKLILKLSLILMVSFYGLTFLMGLNEGGTSDIISRVVKIGLVFLFVSDQGWYMFNAFVVKTFKGGTDQLTFLMATSFDNSPELRNAVDSADYSDKSILFSSIDNVMGLFFAPAVQKKISALLFSGLFGWLYILIIYYALIAYIMAVCTAVLVYLTAQVFISVLFVLGPIFFMFTLFDKTKEMFDKWLQQLIGFSLQQMFLLVTLSFFNMMMYEIIKNSLGYRVCWDEVWTINIIIRISLMSFWTIPNVPPLFDSQAEMGSSGRGEGVPSFFSILFIWMVAKLMREFITFMTSVASDIGGGISATGVAGAIMKSMADTRKGLAKKFHLKEAYNNTIGHGIARMDQKLFGSGRLAKAARKQKRKQDSIDLKNKGAMVSAGRKAVDEFKRKNGGQLATMSQREQQKKLNDVRDQAMNKKGRAMGLNDEQIDKLKKDRGIKYRGDNLVGYAARAAYQRSKAGGSTLSSITSKDTKTDLSKDQARSAIKNADQTGKDNIMKALDKGNMRVEAGRRTKRLSSRIGLPKILESEDHKKARKMLEDSGEITKIRGLGIATNLSRSDADKKLIREAMKDAPSGKMGARSRESTIESLAKFKARQEAKDEGMTGFKATEHVSKEIKEFKAERKAGARLKGVMSELKEKQKNFGELKKEQDNKSRALTGEIDNLKYNNPDSKRYEEVQSKLKAGNISKEEKKELKKESAKLEKKAKANLSLISDKESQRSKADALSRQYTTAMAESANQITAVQEVMDIEAGVDHVLDNQGGFSTQEVKAAKSTKKDLDNFKAANMGVKGGYSAAGVARAAVGAILSPIDRGAQIIGKKWGREAVSDKFKGATRDGILGARQRSTDESMNYIRDKEYSETFAELGKDVTTRPESVATPVVRDDVYDAPPPRTASTGSSPDDSPASGSGEETPDDLNVRYGGVSSPRSAPEGQEPPGPDDSQPKAPPTRPAPPTTPVPPTSGPNDPDI